MDTTRDLERALGAEPEITLAVLFGSAARGAAHRRSDIDVAVLGIHSPDRLAALRVTLSRIAGREVDLVPLETASPLLRFEIARDGVVLVTRSPHVWPDFRARAMVDWWDWAPFARRIAAASHRRLQQQTNHGPS